MTSPTATIRDAREAGRAAAHAGQALHDNPYANDDDAKARVLARMWDAGFVSVDPIPVDYTQ